MFCLTFQLTGMANYIDREVKRRAFVMARWDFREREKMDLDLEAKRKAGVSTSIACLICNISDVDHFCCHWLYVINGFWLCYSYFVGLIWFSFPICKEEDTSTYKRSFSTLTNVNVKLQKFRSTVQQKRKSSVFTSE